MIQKLKSLELYGYKTFALKTVFFFPKQVTAIVGPNGAGKSNIADAIRWVLGEQAYSLLRGKRTVDMIFSGSKQRPRASMASVTITFNNEDGWLPLDFSEIAITRRAYRSGENEYLLNNKRVRLKEINELLANSGLADRTYTIIGQGLVDSALSLRPEERRLFFEEAAGIGLFRSRRDEAVQKLDKTLRNMERAQDIFGEIKPRTQKLKKQVEKVQKYKRIKEDLLVLLKDWYGFKWNRLQKDFLHSQEIVHIKKAELNNVKLNVQKIDKNIGEQREVINKIREKSSKLHREAAKFHAEKEEITRKIAVLDERYKSVREKKESMENSLIFLEEEIKSRKLQLKEIYNQKEKASENLKTVIQSLAIAQDSLTQRKKERKSLQEELKQFRNKSIDLEKSLIENKTRHSELRQRIEELNDNRQNIANSIASGERGLKKAKINIAVLETELEELERSYAENEKAIQDICGVCDEISEAIEKNDEIKRDLEAKIISRNAQLDVLIDAENNLSGFTSGTKSLLNEIKRNKVAGKFNVLLSKIKVEPEYEVAIAAVLGEILEGLILEEDVDPFLILNILDKSDNSRTILLPKALIKHDSDIHKLGSEEYVLATNVVNVSEDVQDLVNSLLSGVFIVSDRKKAKRLMKLIDDKSKIVTKKGEIFTGKGLILAGKVLRSKVFSRSRKRSTLEAEIKGLELKIKQLEKDNNELQEQYRHNIQISNEKKEKLEKQKQAKLEKENSLKKEIMEFDHIRSSNDFKEKQIKIIDEEKAEKEKNRALIGKDIEILEKKRDELGKKIEDYSDNLKTLPEDDFKLTVYSLSTKKAVAEETLISIEKRENDYKDIVSDREKQQVELSRKIIEAINVIEEIEEERKLLQRRNKEINKVLIGLDEKMIPAEKSMSAYEKDRQNLFESSEKARNVLAVAERHHLQAELKLSRIGDKIENVKRRIAEDFGLVSYDYEKNTNGPNPSPIEGVMAKLPKIIELPLELEENIKQQKSILKRMGPINPGAENEYQELVKRCDFITEQLHDLELAEKDLRHIVSELDELMCSKFQLTFFAVNKEFSNIFVRLFGGGSAQLYIEDESNITETGIGIVTTLPGRRKQELASLSGGERSLTAVALIFALLKISPTPFCVLDEVDAMLDEVNVTRFGDLLSELSKKTQFVVITHNRNTVQLADVIYGVTMGNDSTSQIFTINLDALTEEHVK